MLNGVPGSVPSDCLHGVDFLEGGEFDGSGDSRKPMAISNRPNSGAESLPQKHFPAATRAIQVCGLPPG